MSIVLEGVSLLKTRNGGEIQDFFGLRSFEQGQPPSLAIPVAISLYCKQNEGG